MQEFTFEGPLEVGSEKKHVVKIQVVVIPDDTTNVELVKACGIIEKEAKDTLFFSMMLKDRLMRQYLDGGKTDTIEGGEAN